MMEGILNQNPWWINKELIKEDYDLLKFNEKRYKWIPDAVNQIKLNGFALHFLFGPRQVGKTTIIKLIIKKFLAEDLDPKSIFYFNCDNVKDNKELGAVIESYLEFRKENSIKKSLILLDEIASPDDWYRAVKHSIDLGKFKNDVLVLTGSSSISIKKHIELFPGRRGKGVDFLIMPLAFREFLMVTQKALYNNISNASYEKAKMFLKPLNNALKKYMQTGGFPLAIEGMADETKREDAKRTYLSWIKNAVLRSDRSDTIARQVVKTVIDKIPSAMSWEGISKEIEIKSPKTVSAYMELLQSMYTLIIQYSLDISTKKIKFGKNKKIHLIDPLLFDIFEDWCLTKIRNKPNVIAESLLASHLARKHPDQIFFWKNGFEIDTLLLEKDKLHGFEVKWSDKPVINAKSHPALDTFTIITKKEYNKKPQKIPLALFLALLE